LKGLWHAAKDIFFLFTKMASILFISIIIALAFWYLRAAIPFISGVSYKNYVVWLETGLSWGIIPSLWIQQNVRNSELDVFFRWIWHSYFYAFIFGGLVVFLIRADIKRYFLALSLALFFALLIHTILPTQPPWMAIQAISRIGGGRFIQLDRNPNAAMPSVHQAVISLLACAIWRYRLFGKVLAVLYNAMMSVSLIYLGEHFAVDCYFGIIIAIISWQMAGIISRHQLGNSRARS
jgi:small basic protein